MCKLDKGTQEKYYANIKYTMVIKFQIQVINRTMRNRHENHGKGSVSIDLNSTYHAHSEFTYFISESLNKTPEFNSL